jgi:hypothetical protein
VGAWRGRRRGVRRRSSNKDTPGMAAGGEGTIDVLAEKVEALSKVNSDVLTLIEGAYEEDGTVVSGFKYEVKVKLTKTEKGGSDDNGAQDAPRPTTFVTEPVESRVRPLIDAWTGENVEKLEVPKDFFNDKIDYKLANFADVKRLMEQVPTVAEKWTFARDTPSSRAQVRIFLGNLEKLQVALGQLHELIMDSPDPLKGSKQAEVEEGLELVERGWDLVTRHMKGASLEGSAAGGVGGVIAGGEGVFSIDYAGENLSVTDGRIRRGAGEDWDGSVFTLKPALKQGKHVLRANIGNKASSGSWMGLGVCAEANRTQLIEIDASSTAGTALQGSFWGQSGNGYSWPTVQDTGAKWVDGDQVEVHLDCDARTLRLLSFRGGEQFNAETISNVPTPCVFVGMLASEGDELELLI